MLCPATRQSMSRKRELLGQRLRGEFLRDVESGRGKSRIKTTVFEYIEVYCNRRRRHSALGYAIPATLADNIAT